MTERKPPLIELNSLDDGSRGHARQHESHENGTDLTAPELFDGIMIRRVGAVTMDYVIALFLSFILTLATCTASVFTLGLLSIPALLVAPAVLLALMGIFMIGGQNGATLGMRAFGIRVVSVTGRRLDHVQAFLMVAMYFASIVIFFPVLLMGLFMERGRLLHDLVSGTLVIRHTAQ